MPSRAPLDLQISPFDAAAVPPTPALAAFATLWRRLEGMWRAEGGDGPAPPRRLLDIAAMREFLDLVLLSEVVRPDDPDQPVDFRMRVYGTGLAQLYGADLTGWRLSAAAAAGAAGENAAAELHRRYFEATLAARAPLQFSHRLEERAYARRVEGLCLPLTLAGSTIDQLVALEAPVELKRAPTPYL